MPEIKFVSFYVLILTSHFPSFSKVHLCRWDAREVPFTDGPQWLHFYGTPCFTNYEEVELCFPFFSGRFTASQNTWSWKGSLPDKCSSTPLQAKSPTWTMSWKALDISKDGDSKIFLGNLLQCSVTLTEQKVFPLLRWEFPCCLPLGTTEKSFFPSFLHPPFCTE